MNSQFKELLSVLKPFLLANLLRSVPGVFPFVSLEFVDIAKHWVSWFSNVLAALFFLLAFNRARRLYRHYSDQ